MRTMYDAIPTEGIYYCRWISYPQYWYINKCTANSDCCTYDVEVLHTNNLKAPKHTTFNFEEGVNSKSVVFKLTSDNLEDYPEFLI